MNILLACPDIRMSDFLATAIKMHWAEAHVVQVFDAEQALDAFIMSVPDAVILAMDLPGADGHHMLANIRCYSDVPVFILCESGDEVCELRVLHAGADGCYASSTSPLVMVARIDSVMRRLHGLASGENVVDFTCGDFKINYRRHLVIIAGRKIDLTRNEYRLLVMLARNAGQVLTHYMLISAVWGIDSEADGSHLKVLMSRLRGKLEQGDQHCGIETVRGMGYRMGRPPHDSVVAPELRRIG